MSSFVPDLVLTVTTLNDTETSDSSLLFDLENGFQIIDPDTADGEGLTLREALQLAVANELAFGTKTEIQFSSDLTGTILLTQGQLPLPRTVIIDGGSPGAIEIVADAAFNEPIFFASSPDTYSELYNLVLSGGSLTDNFGGAAVQTAGDLVIGDSVFRDNGVTGDGGKGGAIRVGGDLTVTDAAFLGNSTSGDKAEGGAIHGDGSVTLTNTTFVDNITTGSDSNGGAVHTEGELVIMASTFTGNVTLDASSTGGGAFGNQGVTVTNSIVAGNGVTGPDTSGSDLATAVTAPTYQGANIIGDLFLDGTVQMLSGIDVAEIFETTKTVGGLVSGVFDTSDPIPTVQLAVAPVSPAIDAADENFGPSRDSNNNGRVDAPFDANNGKSITDLGATEETVGALAERGAVDDFATTRLGTSVRIPVLENDNSGDGSFDELVVQRITRFPGNGSISINPDRSISYTPNRDFEGTDFFRYRFIDTEGQVSNSATVTIDVIESIPQPVDDRFVGLESTQLEISFAELLANDTHPFGQDLEVVGVTNGRNGETTLLDDSVLFDPRENFSGEARFTYTVRAEDGGESTAQAFIDIARNDDPSTFTRTLVVDTLNDTETTRSSISIRITPDGSTTTVNDVDTADGEGLSLREAAALARLYASAFGEKTKIFFEDGLVGTINLGQGGIALPSNLIIDGDTDGDGIGDISIVADDDANAPIFFSGVFETDYTELNNLTLSGGNLTSGEDGAAIRTVGDLVVRGSVIRDNSVSGDNGQGGAIYAGGDVLIERSALTGNSTSGDFGDGGAVYGEGDVTLRNATIADNRTTGPFADGGGVYAAGTVIVDSSTVTGNVTTNTFSAGGGVFGASGVTAINSILSGNHVATFSVTTANVGVGTGRPGYQGNSIVGGSLFVEGTEIETGIALSQIFETTKTVQRRESGQVDTTQPIPVVPLKTDPLSPAIDAANESFAPATDANGNSRKDAPNDGNGFGSSTDLGNAEADGAPIVLDAVDDSYSVVAGGTISFNVLENDSSGPGAFDTPIFQSIIDAPDAAVGSLTVLPPEADGQLEFTAAIDFFGSFTFSYLIAPGNGEGGTDQADVTIEVINQAPVAGDDTGSQREGSGTSYFFSELLANDFDPEGGELTVVSAGNGVNGRASLASGRVFFTVSDFDYNGPASFDYTVEDDAGNQSTATVNLTITPVNDPTVVVDDLVTTDEDVPAIITQEFLLSNDSDIDGDELSVTRVFNVRNGTADFDEDGNIVFVPSAEFSGTGSFTYRVSSTGGDTQFGSVDVIIAPLQDAPTAVDDAFATTVDTAITITPERLLQNDFHGDGTAFELTDVSGVTGGTLEETVDGDYTFTPDDGFVGEVSFDYEVTDAVGWTDSATATIRVVDGGLEVTTNLDVVDPNDGLTSLREAVAFAADDVSDAPVTFARDVFTGGDASLIRLTLGEIAITSDLTIDGSTGIDVTITGDAADNDLVYEGTHITDVRAIVALDEAEATTADEDRDGEYYEVENSLFDDNSRIFTVGEDLNVRLGDLTVTGGHIRGLDNTGGALDAADGSLIEIVNSTFAGNSTNGRYAHGGAVFVEEELRVENSTFYGNGTIGQPASGGAIAAGEASAVQVMPEVQGDSRIVLVNTTIADNFTLQPLGYGGGVAGAFVTATSTTVTNNSTSGQNAFGGGIYGFWDVTLTNSIVVGNKFFYPFRGRENDDEIYVAISPFRPMVINSLWSTDENVIDGSTVFEVTEANGDVQGGVLADNGGPVLTVALREDGLAVDQGNNALVPAGLTTDARGDGFARIANSNVDLGALEFQGSLNFIGTATDDTFEGGTSGDNFLLRFGADRATGNGGSDVFTIDGRYLNNGDVHRITDLDFSEGDQILFRFFDQPRSIDSQADLKFYTDNGFITIKSTSADGSLDVTLQNLDENFGSNNETFIGTSADDQFIGLDGDDLFLLRFGNDTATGGANTDTFLFDGRYVGSGSKHTVVDLNFADGDVLKIRQFGVPGQVISSNSELVALDSESFASVVSGNNSTLLTLTNSNNESMEITLFQTGIV